MNDERLREPVVTRASCPCERLTHGQDARVTIKSFIRACVCILILIVTCGGCAGAGSGRFIIQSSSRSFSQKFTQAYAAQHEDGSHEFLLIDRKKESAVRQLVHVRIGFLPFPGNVSETLLANATIDWFILSDSPRDTIHYSGVGYGIPRSHKKVIELQLRWAQLKPQMVRGQMADPLGPFELSGKIRAANDPRGLQKALEAVPQ